MTQRQAPSRARKENTRRTAAAPGTQGAAPGQYVELLERKRVTVPAAGIEPPARLNRHLHPFQADIVRWALKLGRAAIFTECGLGKTIMQLSWAHELGKLGHRTLILAPLAVAHQTVREGERFGIKCRYAKAGADAKGKIVVTNYERLDAFDASAFDAVVLDESSILKAYSGATKQRLIETFADHRFRLACTATPAPNDYLELGNQAEFLGVMSSHEMLTRFFINDSMAAGAYRLKGHAVRDFWRWVSSWAVMAGTPSDLGEYSDDGYVLPPLTWELHQVEAEVERDASGHLFAAPSLNATEIHKVKRQTAAARAEAAAAIVATELEEQWLVWCDTNYEADELTRLIPGAVEVRGSDSADAKTEALVAFADGRERVLVTKPDIAGHGMNLQRCARVVFVGLSYSFERLYQAVRRVWRYGQTRPVMVHVVEASEEAGIRSTVERKMADYDRMKAAMVAELRAAARLEMTGLPVAEPATGHGFTLWRGDCVDVMSRMDAESVDFSVFSPPFANLYIYSASIADMGNCASHEEFFAQFRHAVRELLRITANGRLCAVHCKDLPAFMNRDGYAGLIDFPGATIRLFEEEGWRYHSRVTIWKDPVAEVTKTNNHGLLHLQLCKDSSASRQGMADYLVVFRKWGEGAFERPVTGPAKTHRFTEYVGTQPPDRDPDDARGFSIETWQRYASPVWFDIDQTDVLNAERGPNDEKHLCPLQLGVIRRAVHLWTNPGDVVFSPFAGIGSEGHVALQMGRRFVGVELNETYHRQAVEVLRAATIQRGLFDSEETA